MSDYKPNQTEAKWQKEWEKSGIYKTPEITDPKNKMYVLPQLPYPSGSGLHVGHAEVYTACDIYARYQRMIGKDVLQVIGWDSFGLPAENYAIKTNVHPKESTDTAVDNFRKQIKSLGISVDWDREVGSHNPDYYKWTQWFFLLMYKRGLAYRKNQAVNWCESCKTVLANAQVVDGACERCDTTVIQKEMEQWYIRITDYAEKLLEGLDKIDWPEETKKRQRDWVGKSEGAEIEFGVKDSEEKIIVFTTRPDTIFGATYMVLAPEHNLVQTLQSQISNWKDVQKYIDETAKKTDLDRQVDKEKTGVELKGIKAVNPVNGEKIPVWIADYVLASYGTGAIMAVPAHDERDFAFAKKYGLEIKKVISYTVSASNASQLVELADQPYVGEGIAIGSGFLDHLETKEAKKKIIKHVEEKGFGKGKTQYKLRDWSVSRQRFWGAPVPMLVNEARRDKKRTFVLVHGYGGNGASNYFPDLKSYLEDQGHTVLTPNLPNTHTPNLDEQVAYLKENITLDEDSVVLGHSLGGPVVVKWLTDVGKKVSKVIFSDSVVTSEFNDTKRPDVQAATDWSTYDYSAIKDLAEEIVMVVDENYPIIKKEDSEKMAENLGARIVNSKPEAPHFNGVQEPIFYDEVPVSGLLPLETQDLPVELPNDVDFKPTGQSPLTYSESFQDGVEETYGAGWKREVDTLDTFMCSSWYYYRYLDPKNNEAFASPEALKNWMPVDFYLGGEEHVNGHLLYARFFTKVLHDAGYIDFDEPFTVHRHQGLILGSDSRKMSKRWGNVINPTDVVETYGADTCRMYEMFMGPLEETKPWSENGVKGIRRFLERVWKLQEKLADSTSDADIDSLVHKTIKKVTDDIPQLGFNTAIAKLMELSNAFGKSKTISKDHFEAFLKLLAPFAPHITEEMWEALGHDSSVTTESWPTYEQGKLVDDVITLVVQVNGKVRGKLEVAADISEDDAKAAALAHENVAQWLDEKEPKKVIYVKGKLVSIVV